MKNLLNAVAFSIALTMTVPAIAADPFKAKTILTGVEQTRAGIMDKYAGINFCSLGKPKGKPGSILIWWSRDALGRCTIQNVEVVK